MKAEPFDNKNRIYKPLFKDKYLYHFCAKQFLPSIRKNGLRIGKMPWGAGENRIKLLPGYQWLTSNGEFQQSWNEGSSLPYDRTEVRLTISMPASIAFSLIKWTDFKNENPLYETLSAYGDPENWYVFKGTIIPFWIRDIQYKPQLDVSPLSWLELP